ncbi:SprT-like domain-containing protein [Vibrio agarivorans]|uniref:SprT-like domain-containing protein n=1 Tax=Vibrio agarivorans TaxID=153622 RepID=UPI0025B3F74A|nr:SprT-like domain-containing protein [Vibrio agarivorans]MDN3661163.1 SprT-like domain-containing protein [Vibrio agarivorans]
MPISAITKKAIEREALTIVGTACLVASRTTGIELPYKTVVLNTVLSWQGSRTSHARINERGAGLYFALHELFACEMDGRYFYSESSALARSYLPPAYMTPNEALCSLIAHEVAHLYMFHVPKLRDRNNHHHQSWLDLMLTIRERLVSVFCFCVTNELEQHHKDASTINMRWQFIRHYVRCETLKECGALLPAKPSRDLDIIAKLIIRLRQRKAVRGLYLMSERLFV